MAGKAIQVSVIGGLEEPAVQIVGAYKRYGKGPWILNNLNMTVPKNGIYGLLGSSGCGKTTLLTALTGFSSLDHGSIRVSIPTVSKLGFMPQEIGLFEEFTIGETFTFFARLYNISQEQCTAVTNELKSVLDLPADDQRCSTLSGGQARRVSIAVALLHSPEIVILDEPTSGIDPLLAHCFWKYLTRLSRSGTCSVIITTHYIEEARQADMVGLMRNGTLLAENPPEDLIRMYKVTSLEDVFLQLCYTQDETQEGATVERTPIIQFQHPYKGKSTDLSTVWPHTKAIFYKITTWIRANLLMFITAGLLFSVVCIFGCNEMLSSFPPTSVGFVNDETGGDCKNQTALEPALECGRNQLYENLGCKYIHTWRSRNPNIPMIYYSSFDDAMQDGKRGKVAAVLRISSNFSHGISARLETGMNSNKQLISNSNIDVYGDTSEYMRTLKVEVELHMSFVDMYRDLLTSCGYDKRVADMPPMQIKTNVFVGDNVEVDMFDYNAYVCMNVIAGLTCLCPVLLIIPLLSVDKMSGAYGRCHLAGVKTAEIFYAHGLFLMGYNLVNVGLVLFTYYTFYWTPRGSIWLTFLILNIGGLSGILCGLLIVVLTRGVKECMSFLIVYMIAMFSFTGYCWPVEAVWPPLQPLSFICFPNTLISIAYRAVEWKGATILHPEVVDAILFSILFVTLHAAVIGFLIRRKPSFTST